MVSHNHKSRLRVLIAVLTALAMADAALSWPEVAAKPVMNAPVAAQLQDSSAAVDSDPEIFYRGQVDGLVQQNCLVCHREGGAAPAGGARLVLSDSHEKNHQSFVSMLGLQGVTAEWILEKISGQNNHGGGQVAPVGSTFYEAMKQYLLAVQGGLDVDAQQDFWRGTVQEAREVTLRRASLLFSGQVAKEAAIAAARDSESGLRRELLAAMSGDGFHDFLVTGAADKLLVDALLINGFDFEISTRDRFPEFSKLLVSLPDEKPEQYEDFHDKPFLTQGDADMAFRWAITREPLELIAHVIMTDKPYKQVLTADYTMVNAFSDLAYRSDSGFQHDFADNEGFFDRSLYGDFRPGRNNGHIPHDSRFWFQEDAGITSFSGYQVWPHSGVLSTQAWLSRYPSTDTNRNRARARWTYYHFLGVDIEKSAPRTTDPAALADTNNPTMKNSACTVCHERLDPVAGAYQSFGDKGHYLDQYGGLDSLSDAYKCPECYGGERGSTGYQVGDTWYRDMRRPGFEGKVAGGSRDSIQWLGYRVANDPRFAEAAVRFWWPAVFGVDPLLPPTDADARDYEQHLRAFAEQDKLIKSLADKFKTSGFSAKALFAEMVLSPWYRRSEVADAAIASARSMELASVGRGRLLTPEELDRKTLAIFGRTWRQWEEGPNPHDFTRETALSGHRAQFKVFYGGMDGATVTSRNRELTPLMSNVVESMATDLACQVVIQDFNRPPDQRMIFDQIDGKTVPGAILDETASLPGKVYTNSQRKAHSVTANVQLVGGAVQIRIEDQTRNPHQSLDDEHTWTELTISEVIFKQGMAIRARFSGDNFTNLRSFSADTWTDDEGEQHWRGWAERGAGWSMHTGAWAQFEANLPAGSYEVEFRMATKLPQNNVNDHMTAGISLVALDNISQTASAQAVRSQLSKLILNSTSRQVSDLQLDKLIDSITNRATEARKHGSWFRGTDGHCDTWSIWPNEQLTQEQRWDRYGDPSGMMRAWTMFTHGLLTSFGYTHD